MNTKIIRNGLALVLGVAVLTLAGCKQEEGAGEKAGKEVDEAVAETQEATEEAREDLGKAVEDAGKKISGD